MEITINKELFQWEKNRYVYIKLEDNEEFPSYLQFYNKKSLLFWNKYLSENDDIKKRMINFFGKTEYVATVSRRYFE